jgi:hypothetical protein
VAVFLQQLNNGDHSETPCCSRLDVATAHVRECDTVFSLLAGRGSGQILPTSVDIESGYLLFPFVLFVLDVLKTLPVAGTVECKSMAFFGSE